MRRISGWAARNPYLLKEVPSRPADLVWEVRNIWGNFDPPNVYESQTKAWEVVTENLTQMQNRYSDILDSLSKPQPSNNNGSPYTPPEVIEDVSRDIREGLHIAERGLAICQQRKR